MYWYRVGDQISELSVNVVNIPQASMVLSVEQCDPAATQDHPECFIHIGNTSVLVTVDSGSPVTIISDTLFSDRWSHMKLSPPDIKTVVYGGQDIPMLQSTELYTLKSMWHVKVTTFWVGGTKVCSRWC